jgi:hypothetical protein
VGLELVGGDRQAGLDGPDLDLDNADGTEVGDGCAAGVDEGEAGVTDLLLFIPRGRGDVLG